MLESSPLLVGRRREKTKLRISYTDKAAIIIGVVAALCVGAIYYVARTTVHDVAMINMRANTNLDFSGDLRARCSEHYMEQPLNHFKAIPDSYRQRYFICDEFWTSPTGPIFFYFGHDDDVELYLNHTGLMWENAPEFGAMLVFAEHRFFGKSMPRNAVSHLEHLSSKQVLADHAALINHIKRSNDGTTASPVIGFGGSYGAMLGIWFHTIYLEVMAGLVAAAAPLVRFLGGDPLGNSTALVYNVSRTVIMTETCASNIQRAWNLVLEAAKSPEEMERLQSQLGLCEPLASAGDVNALVEWIQTSYNSLTSGSLPSMSLSIVSRLKALAETPLQEARAPLASPFPLTTAGNSSLLGALRESIDAIYNSTADKSCYSVATSPQDDIRDCLFCLESNPLQDLARMRSSPQLPVFQRQNCATKWKLSSPSSTSHYKSWNAVRSLTNLVLSYNPSDPWTNSEMLQGLSDSTIVIEIHDDARNLDLMFSSILDSESVKAARIEERKHMKHWIQPARPSINPR
ncbi:unnamed protein product [Aphanomyces euteiches]